MFISKKAIPRRTVLRGLGASLALPLLDGMVPAYAALRTTAAKPVRRLGVCYVPNGMEMRAWTPKGDSRQLELSPILQPLEPYREQVNVLSGLADNVLTQLALDRLLLLFVVRLPDLVVVSDHGDIIAGHSLTASPKCVFCSILCKSLSIKELRARGGRLVATRSV
mgnify:CR=1 FL=1